MLADNTYIYSNPEDDMKTRLVLAATVLACLILNHSTLEKSSADEGMWLFNNLPLKHLKEQHDFEPTGEWAE